MEIGDLVIIKDNNSFHGFKIEEVVRITDDYFNSQEAAYFCENINGNKWAVLESDIKKVKAAR